MLALVETFVFIVLSYIHCGCTNASTYGMVEMMRAEQEVKKLLETFSAEERAIAEELAHLRIENRMLQHQAKVLRKDYDELYKVLVVILDVAYDKELRVSDTQFKRFKEEYRIDRSYDEETKEVVLRLKTLRDPVDG